MKNRLQSQHAADLLGKISSGSVPALKYNFSHFDFSDASQVLPLFKENSLIAFARRRLSNPVEMIRALIELGAQVSTDELIDEIYTLKYSRDEVILLILQAMRNKKQLISQELMESITKEFVEGVVRRKPSYDGNYTNRLYLLIINHNRLIKDEQLISVDGSTGYEELLKAADSLISSSSEGSLSETGRSSRAAKQNYAESTSSSESEGDDAASESSEYREADSAAAQQTPKLGNFISVEWPEYAKFFNGYVVEIDPDQKNIKVIYTNSDVKWHSVANIKYVILNHKPTCNKNLKDKEGFLYKICKRTGSVTKVALAAESAAAAESSSCAVTSDDPRSSESSELKTLSAAATPTLAAASTTSPDEVAAQLPIPVAYPTPPATASPNPTAKRRRVSPRTTFHPTFKPENVAELPPFIGFSAGAMAVANSSSSSSSAAAASVPEHRSTPDSEVIDLTGDDPVTKKMLEEQAKLAAAKAELERQSAALATKLHARQELIRKGKREAAEKDVAAIDRTLRGATAEIEAAATGLNELREIIESIKQRVRAIEPDTRRFMQERLQQAGLFGLPQLQHTARDFLLEEIQKLNASATELGALLGGAAVATASATTSSSSSSSSPSSAAPRP